MKRETAIRGVKVLLGEIDIVRAHPRRGQKAPPSVIYSARLPLDIVEEFKTLSGYQNHNIETAMRLLLMVRAHTRSSGETTPKNKRKGV